MFCRIVFSSAGMDLALDKTPESYQMSKMIVSELILVRSILEDLIHDSYTSRWFIFRLFNDATSIANLFNEYGEITTCEEIHIWYEAVVVICLERLREITENSWQNKRYIGRDSNGLRAKYEAGALASILLPVWKEQVSVAVMLRTFLLHWYPVRTCS
jgi:hypothetical protein